MIASAILQKTRSATEVWDDLFVGRATNLAQRALEQAARREAATLSKTPGGGGDGIASCSSVDWLFSKSARHGSWTRLLYTESVLPS